MKVSVLIPLYNAEDYIARTIQCVLNQTWHDNEIIIVDDGSTDQSLNIAKTFESENVKIISQTNKGAAAARNIAFRFSTGDYIQYLDADDILSDDKIEKQMKLAGGYSYNPKILFTCKTNFFTTYTNYSESIIQPTDKSYETPIELLIDLFANISFISSHAFLTPRHLILQAGEWNEELSANDDGDFFGRVISNSIRVIHSDEGIAYYRKTPNSLSKQKSLKHSISELQTLRNITKIILINHNIKSSRAACSKIFNWFIVEWFPENKPILREVEKTMKKFGLTYFSGSNNKIYHLIRKVCGWRRAMLFSEFISTVKNQ
jgi:glycosyltransferase involved in cell wall biosynthesis